MRFFDRIREYLRRHNDLSTGRDPVWDDAAGQARTQTMPAADYEPHGIDTPATLAELVAKAEADAQAAQASAQTVQWGEWDEPPAALAHIPAVEAPPPPPMPYPGELSNAMVHQITYPDPSDLSLEKDRKYRDMLRRVGVATGTHTSLEDTRMWALPALEPGDGTGVRLAAQEHGETGPEVAA